MMEALVCHPLGQRWSKMRNASSRVLTSARHNQSSNAALKKEASARSKTSYTLGLSIVLMIALDEAKRFF
jgi:hypothetical protein